MLPTSATAPDDKTVELGSNTSLADLTVENRYSGGDSYAIYVKPGAKDSYLHYVGAYADYDSSGQYNHYAYYANDKDIDVHIKYGYFYAKYGEYNYGVYNSGGAKTYIQGWRLLRVRRHIRLWALQWWQQGLQELSGCLLCDGAGEKASNSNYGLYNGKYAEAKLNKGYYYGYYNGAGQYCYGICNEWADLVCLLHLCLR